MAENHRRVDETYVNRTNTSLIKVNTLWDKICNCDNIYQAVNHVLKYSCPEQYIDRIPLTKRHWLFTREIGEIILLNKLLSHTYDFSEYSKMTVYEPKERFINYHSDWTNNVLEISVLNIIEPIYINHFSTRTFGSIKGRGLKKALKLLSEICSKYPNGYFIQIDCKKYFQSIDQEILKSQIRELFKEDEQLIRFMINLIESFFPGIPIGSPLSQFNANLYLTPVDKFLDNNPLVIDFIRNMDDIIIVLPDKKSAQIVLKELFEKFRELKLTIKNNYRVAPLTYGIDALGYVIYPTHIKVRKKIKIKMKKKMKNLLTKNLPDKDIKQKMASYYGWCIHGDCRNLLQKVFKDKLKLFNKMSKLERIGKLNSNSKKVFGLDKDKRISIIDLINKDIVILGMEEIVIKGVSKLAIKFCFLDSVGEDPDTEELEKNSKYTITSSKVLQDRLDKDKNHFPGIITIKKNEKKNYLFYDRFEDDDVED